MTKETKQDVFDRLLKEHCKTILDLNPASAETDVKQIVENVFRDHYADASPCKLPVIPDAVGDFITDWKSNHRGLFLAIISCNDVLAGFSTPPITNGVAVWVAKYTDTFAIAWLLGDWEVEDG